MSENIELYSLGTNATKDSDIEEYHEINQELQETTFSPKYPLKTFEENDFFTKQDVKVRQKESGKRKKPKKKEKSTNLMDIINCELASVAVPIVENVITFAEDNSDRYNSLLERTPRLSKFGLRRLDSENGWEQKTDLINLNPVFPRVLENTVREDLTIPVQYVKPALFNDLISDNVEKELKQSPKFLDVEIRNLKFKHHHHFSLEKLLSVKLMEYYNEYNIIQQSLKDLCKEIKINRETRNNLKEELLKINPNKKEDLRFDKTIRKYTGKLLEMKEKFLNTLQNQKEIIHKVMSLWSDLEMVREKSKNQETCCMLEVKRDILDQDEFEKEWNDVFHTEYNDMLDKIELEFVNKYIEYKEIKSEQNLDDSAKKRISKPKLQIDEDALKEDVEALVNNIVLREKVEINLKEDGKIKSELIKYGKNLLKSKFYFEIYVDDIFVCESEFFTTKEGTTSDIEFTESFAVQILPKNTILSIVLFENDREISKFKTNLSDIKRSNLTAEFVPELFICNDILAPNSRHIGSGHNIKEIATENKVRLKSSNIFKGNLYTTSEVNIKMGWNDRLNQNDSEDLKCLMETGRQIKRLLHGVDKPSTELLKDLINKLYDKDVGNDVTMINSLKDLCRTDITSQDTFPIDESSPEFVRLKLLHLRNIGGFTNIEDKLVPLHSSQISTEQLSCLQKSNENEFDVQYYSDKYSEMDPIELQRYIGSKYVQKLNKNMLTNLNEHLLRKTHKDVVRDFKDLSLRSLFTNQSSLATLTAMSSCTRQELLTEALGKEQEIRVTVLRAFSLMDRSAAVLEEECEDQIAGFKVRPLRPFVRISYRGATAQTATAIGCHPTWNQTVKISARLEPLSCLHINVYDEHLSAIGEDEPHTVRYRSYSRWLGVVRVPLHSVLAVAELRGTFKISSPPMLFGYETLAKQSSQSLIPAVTQLMKKVTSYISLHITTSLSYLGGLHEYKQPTNPGDDYVIKHLNTFVSEYVNDFPSRNISLTFIDSSGKNRCVTQFLQPIPLPDTDSFPKNPKIRSESALSKSSGVSKSSSSKSSKRRDEERVSYQEEKESIYSGNEGSWRNGESQLTRLMNASLRYVSLIPTYEVTGAHTVTLMGLELLKVLHGSPLDHCILLGSYLLQLGVRCWVAAGRGLPRGPAAYVLVKHDLPTGRVLMLHDQERVPGLWSKPGCVWHVWDAVSGETTELRDVGCPMKTVNYVFDNENIWVNIQSSVDCESVSFDFSKSSDWQPVFDKTIFVMKQPTASEPIYSVPADVERLRLSLETRLREKVLRWRPHVKTVWNRYCSSLLREMLPHWEYWAFTPTSPKPVVSQRLKQLMVTFKLFGFPLNIPYTNTKSVISTVKTTGVHANDDPNAEFALAVEVYAYPNNVISVWVFFASITRL